MSDQENDSPDPAQTPEPQGEVHAAEPEDDAAPKKKPSLKDRLAELGTVGLVVYLVIFALTVAGFAIAISLGLEVESAGGGTGVLFAAWVATKFTQPLRIGATMVVTPFVVALWHKIRPPTPESDEAGETQSEEQPTKP